MMKNMYCPASKQPNAWSMGMLLGWFFTLAALATPALGVADVAHSAQTSLSALGGIFTGPFIFALGVVGITLGIGYFAYHIILSATSTAHEGDVPIRLVLRIALRAAWPYILFIAILLLMALPSISFAQVGMGSLPSIEGINESAGTVQTDISRRILQRMFEDFADKPFAAVGAADTLLGRMFFTFNAVVFVVGTSYMGYRIVMAIATSAHEGEVLGKRMNSLWEPIRVGVGVFGMLPAFQGFSLAQAVIMGSAILGIGMANMMVKAAVGAADEFKALIPPPGLISSINPQSSITTELADNLFIMNVCVRASHDYLAWYQRLPGASFLAPTIRSTDEGITTHHAMTECGDILIKYDESSLRTNTTLADGWSFSNLWRSMGVAEARNPAVNYEAINSTAVAAMQRRKAALHNVQAEMEDLADKWYTQAKKGETTVEYPREQIAEIIQKANQQEREAFIDIAENNIDSTAFTKGTKEKMLEGGWLAIGSWYSAFAEQDAAIQSAFMATSLEVVHPDFSATELPPEIEKPIIKILDSKKKVDDREGATCMFGQERNALGHCNWGQDIGLSLIGVLNNGGTGMVNPILTSKSIGDAMLNTVGAIMAYKAGSDFLSKDSGRGEKGTAAGEKQSGAVNKLKNMLSSFTGKMFGTILFAFLMMGIVLAVYVPLIPFVTWFTGAVSYFASVIEGLVGAQIWAFMHLSGDGEGMGQRTEKGYVYILNVLFRPALMVVGFFFAAALMTLMATFLWDQFGTAIANLQGDSNTGVFIIMGMMFVYMILVVTLIQTLCNLIYEIPDRVIAWFGHSMDARLAQNMDAETDRKVGASARWTGTAMLGGGRM